MRVQKNRLILLALCAVMLLLTATALASEDVWYCPLCGLRNEYNFCPRDGTARPVLPDAPNAPVATATPAPTPVNGLTTMNLATRTGPATEYTEPGTFRVKDQYVAIYSIAYDVNNVPWVQCEVTYAGKPMRVYTGLKRFDTSTFNVSAIPEEYSRGLYRISTDYQLRYGPGTNYADMKTTISAGSWVTVTNEENGWYQIEFDLGSSLVRGWLPAGYAN